MCTKLSTWSVIVIAFIARTYHQVDAFGVVPCRLHPDIARVYATSIFFEFHEAIQDVDTIEIQCSRLLNGRGFDTFDAQNIPSQDVSNLILDAFGLKQIVVSGLMKGTLYHCRCLSSSTSLSWTYESQTLSLATLAHTKDGPVMQPNMRMYFEKSEFDTTLKLKWTPLAQDIDSITLQVG